MRATGTPSTVAPGAQCQPATVLHLNHSLRAPLWKRVLDLTVIVLLSPVIVPVMASIAVVLRFVSKGPILFRQERIGLGGKPFQCLKFRSMVAFADTREHQRHLQYLVKSGVPMTKLDVSGDTRLIRGGSLLRATGLDELPQLINVWRGDMSLVGPRPCVPYEYEMYGADQKQRFTVLPGLTGLWQVSGKNKRTFDEMVQLDVYYAKNQSFKWDIQILIQTGPAILVQTFEWFKKKRRLRATNQTTLEKKQIADSI